MSEKIYIFKFENRSVEADALEGSVRDVSAAHNVQSLHMVLFEETVIRAEQAVDVFHNYRHGHGGAEAHKVVHLQHNNTRGFHALGHHPLPALNQLAHVLREYEPHHLHHLHPVTSTQPVDRSLYYLSVFKRFANFTDM